ncbi:hypothetical protein [Micromonospora sp. 050-3]
MSLPDYTGQASPDLGETRESEVFIVEGDLAGGSNADRGKEDA